MTHALRALIGSAQSGQLRPEDIKSIDVAKTPPHELRGALVTACSHQPDVVFLMLEYSPPLIQRLGADLTTEIRHHALDNMTSILPEAAAIAQMSLTDEELLTLCLQLRLVDKDNALCLDTWTFVTAVVGDLINGNSPLIQEERYKPLSRRLERIGKALLQMAS